MSRDSSKQYIPLNQILSKYNLSLCHIFMNAIISLIIQDQENYCTLHKRSVVTKLTFSINNTNIEITIISNQNNQIDKAISMLSITYYNGVDTINIVNNTTDSRIFTASFRQLQPPQRCHQPGPSRGSSSPTSLAFFPSLRTTGPTTAGFRAFAMTSTPQPSNVWRRPATRGSRAT